MTHFHGIHCYGLRFSLSVVHPLPPRRYYGSWLRDFLGQALFSGTCIYSNPQCTNCALRGQCAYPQVFQPSLLQQALPAYVLHDWHVSPNRQSFWFSLIFIGSAVRFAEAWINHIAAYVSSEGCLEQVRDLATRRVLFINGRFKRRARLSPLNFVPLDNSQVLIKMVSPLVSKYQHSDLLLAALRSRLQRLVNDYGNGDNLFLDTIPWRISQLHLHPTIIPRSAEQDYSRAGKLGTIVLSQVSSEGAAWLAAGQFLHAGGGCEYGVWSFFSFWR
jgi:hypothetical protein